MAINNKPLPTIGVDKYAFAKVLTDTKEGTTYDEVVMLAGMVEISPSDSGNTSTFDADNGAYVSTSYIESTGHSITNADIPPEIDAMWRGLELKNGGVEFTNKNTETPSFGVMWRVLKAEGGYRYIRYYKGKYGFASNVGGKTKPSSGAPDFQTAQATYTGEARDSDGNIFYYVDDNTLPAGVTKEEIEEKWFTDPNWYPEVV